MRSMRPVVPAPDEPMHLLKVSSHPPFLGTASGSGRYPEGATAKLVATAAENRGNFVRWEDADGKQLGTSPTLDLALDG